MCGPLPSNNMRIDEEKVYFEVWDRLVTPITSTGLYILREKAVLTLAQSCHDVVVNGAKLTQVTLGADCKNIKLTLGENSSVAICSKCTDVSVVILGQTAEQVLRSKQWKLERLCSNITLNGKKIT